MCAVTQNKCRMMWAKTVPNWQTRALSKMSWSFENPT